MEAKSDIACSRSRGSPRATLRIHVRVHVHVRVYVHVHVHVHVRNMAHFTYEIVWPQAVLRYIDIDGKQRNL